MVRYCRYYNTTAFVVGSLRYNYHSLRADNDIAIGFSGSEDGGTISVTSNGGVVISGQINNANGTTSITASGGDILNATETDSISTGNLTLAATSGSIGTAANPIRINQSETDNLTISAGQNVNVASPAGSLYINSINVGGAGAIRLSANQNVELKGSGVLTGHTIDIVAEEGTATSAGGIFRVNTDAENGGTLSIASGGGNINVEETVGDLRINQLITSDNVTITVVDGDLLDGNSEQVDDEIAISDLNALVDQMGLTGTAAVQRKTIRLRPIKIRLKRSIMTISRFVMSAQILIMKQAGMRMIPTSLTQPLLTSVLPLMIMQRVLRILKPHNKQDIKRAMRNLATRHLIMIISLIVRPKMRSPLSQMDLNGQTIS